MKVKATIINLNIPGRNLKNTLTIKAATSKGNKQYPRRHIHCIRDNLPPRSFVFNVIILEPIHIITKTVVNTMPESFFDVNDKILMLI
jgi:hypothetical protein